ncbi:MAG TPA: branched-chain amino acid ABC transporter [Arcobacter sp.]|nr:branched-chain amino acid ABC transporter [Arcobacter sp.]
MTNNELFLAIAVMTIANFITRVVPFLFFAKKEPPEYIVFIEKSFPPIIMTILIFYTLGKIDFSVAPYGLKELFAVSLTTVLHIKYSNYLVSIFLGTAFYMYLVQFIV